MRTAVAVSAVVLSLAVPGVATAAPAGEVQQAARAVTKAWYAQDSSTRRIVCLQWKTRPVPTGKKYARILIRNGYTANAASKGVVMGMLTVCGKPYGYQA